MDRLELSGPQAVVSPKSKKLRMHNPFTSLKTSQNEDESDMKEDTSESDENSQCFSIYSDESECHSESDQMSFGSYGCARRGNQ